MSDLLSTWFIYAKHDPSHPDADENGMIFQTSTSETPPEGWSAIVATVPSNAEGAKGSTE